jgi:ParB family chromosome partitioning protein
MIRRGLGRGLEALIPGSSDPGSEIREININDIEPNGDQPRKRFEEEALKSLAESIKKHGVVQPIIVSKEGERFKIIAGERRWRASRLAGLSKVPVIIKEYVGSAALEVALIENIQRQDLNAIEEAKAYQRLSEDYSLTQEQIAENVGKSRPAIANLVRLLTLDPRVQDMVVNGIITSGHARVLISISDKEKQYLIAKEFEKKKISVRDAEELVKSLDSKVKKAKKARQEFEDVAEDITEKLKKILGTKVELKANGSKGKIIIDYFSNEELERLLELIYCINKKAL